MSNAIGRLCRLKKGGVVIASLRTKSLSINNENIDVTTDDDSGLRTLLDEPGEKSVEISADGLGYQSTLTDYALGSTSQDTFAMSYGGTAEKSKCVCIADDAGSLNNTYFIINAPAGAFHVWLDVNSGGTDPDPGGSTGIEVDIATGATAAAVATAIAAAITANANFHAYASGAAVYIRNADVGTVTDIADTGLTGFAVSVLTQGTAADYTISGTFAVSSYSEGMPYKDAITFSMSLQSSGAVTRA